jgi:hypothetical protein
LASASRIRSWVIESLTGSKEAWYINGFASTEELAQVTEAFRKKQELLAAMNRFTRVRELSSGRSPIAKDLRHTGPS